MNYEEKRELRLQISQLLADAGLNQKNVKDMIDKEIVNKVERAIDQKLKVLDSQCSCGSYIEQEINRIFTSPMINYNISTIIKDELKNRVIQVVLKDVEKV